MKHVGHTFLILYFLALSRSCTSCCPVKWIIIDKHGLPTRDGLTMVAAGSSERARGRGESEGEAERKRKREREREQT